MMITFAGMPYKVRLNNVNYSYIRNIHTVSRACVTNRNSRSPYVSPGTGERGQEFRLKLDYHHAERDFVASSQD